MFSTNVTSNYQDTFSREDRRGSGSNILHVHFDPGITGSVRIFGSVSPDCDFVELTEAPITANALFPILPVPLIRIETTVTGGGGGAALVKVRAAF